MNCTGLHYVSEDSSMIFDSDKRVPPHFILIQAMRFTHVGFRQVL